MFDGPMGGIVFWVIALCVAVALVVGVILAIAIFVMRGNQDRQERHNEQMQAMQAMQARQWGPPPPGWQQGPSGPGRPAPERTSGSGPQS